jgi:ABC-type antimicrobial peptide transport system permease subunit
LRVGALGLSVGFVAAVIATRLLASWLFGVGSFDAASFTVGGILLLTAALLASYLPSQRAARLDPMVALRHE